MRHVIGIDPGTTSSGFVIYNVKEQHIVESKQMVNTKIESFMDKMFPDDIDLCIETMGYQGPTRHVGRETFRTNIWIGRFLKSWKVASGREAFEITRQLAVAHLCKGKFKMKTVNGRKVKDGTGDSQVRRAIIDRFGGEDLAIGGKRCKSCGGKGWFGTKHTPCLKCGETGWTTTPGPLRTVAGHQWQALAVALTHADYQSPTFTEVE